MNIVWYNVIIIIVVIISMYIGSLVAILLTEKINLPEVCKTWNDSHVMELSIGVGALLTAGIVSLLNYSVKNSPEIFHRH